MNKYLHAMGIQCWRRNSVAASQDKLLIVADENDEILQNPVVQTVLGLLHIDPSVCCVSTHYRDEDQVLWDLSGSVANATLRTLPLAQLQQSRQAKRELWQQICAYQEQC